MMLSTEQENKVHPFAVQFAIEHYQDAVFPKSSVILIAAEKFADNHSTTDIAPYQLVRDCFFSKADKILRILRNEAPARVSRS